MLVKKEDTKVLSDALRIDDKIPFKVGQGYYSSLKHSSNPADLSNTSLEEYQRAVESDNLSEGPKMTFNEFSNREQHNIPSIDNTTQNRANFITLGTISKQEKIEIIQTGFQLQAEGKISLKKYYESTDPNSLFQSKGYSIKYESIRRIKLFQQLKP